MDFIKKFFSSKDKAYDHKEEDLESLDTSSMSIDEKFVFNFIKQGGHFFYPDDMDDFKNELLKLLDYLKLNKYLVLERSYFHFLKKLEIPVTDQIDNAGALLGGCEYLIAEEGAVLTTEKNTKEYRNTELPKKRIIIALSTQIVSEKSEALVKINHKYQKPPANIQTMSIFAKPKYGLSGLYWYDTYLFLIEN